MTTSRTAPRKMNENERKFSGSLWCRQRKANMLKALFKHNGQVTASAREVGIERATYSSWLKDDPAFAAEVNAVEQSVDDWFEDAFKSLVKDGNPQAVIHAAKTRLRSRGYGEKLEVDAHVTGSGAFLGALAVLEGRAGAPEAPAVETEAEVVDDTGEEEKRRERAPRRVKRSPKGKARKGGKA